ncbi:uncharacterized protein EV422DRAFT_535954 [Fimicolochytrium jonesii]|uniref:uncharacterized protein n=1 Tax=Fimicolochytrium jonesii TaxID=1396493 RepID=UPI0022FE45D4|nr:uncharacterized protein EV422DRAFT_535954 [Fimicolochytrium jonesii]KAI8818935.1 hypothetical protein EV422DRAFT_535954 [Fimicolochytrium jonesii]
MWKNVVFSDESSFSIYSSTRVMIWREHGDAAKYQAGNLVPKVQKNGGSVMVWGCISWEGVGPLHICEGKVNSEHYSEKVLDTIYIHSCLG